MADLERVLQQLHDSEINAGVQTFLDAGMRIWIGDEMNGIQAETTINRTRAARLKWPEGPSAARCCMRPHCASIPIANVPKSTYSAHLHDLLRQTGVWADIVRSRIDDSRSSIVAGPLASIRHPPATFNICFAN